MLHPNFIILGAILVILGDLEYLFKTIKGQIKPNRVTWLMWGIAPLITFFAQLSKGVGIASFLALGFAIVPFAIVVATVFNKKSFWKITQLDLACAALSALGLILWYLEKDANIAILLSILADLFAALPTIKKSYTHPETEAYLTYVLTSVGGIIALLTIKVWTFENYAFPFYVFSVYAAFVIIIKLRAANK